MLRYGSRRTVSTTTTTTEDSRESSSERRIRRLRLTLHAGDNGAKETKTADTAEAKIDVNETWKKRNGLIHRERPAGRESPRQHLGDTTNGVPEHHGPKLYGIVQRTRSDRQQEVMACEWTVSHLQDEMRYIREVRDSLEKVRERMYGQFGGMQQTMDKLSQEIRASNSHRSSLESEVKVRTSAMESFDQMNSSLISANIGLQKSLLENCQDRVETSKEVKSLRSTCEKTKEKLRDKERELAAAQAENQTLRLQVESSQEANSQALQELSAKLQREYEEKLQEEQRKHREEIENLQAQLDEYIRRLEEAEIKIRMAEAKISERDQRIMEVERLLDCMGKEKSQLHIKLQECEQRLHLMDLTDTTDATVVKRSKELQGEAVDLRERIKHLNDMVFCQQRKVKGMIEEVQSLRAQVAQKDMFISELLDRIAIVECENNELEDKLKYFMSTQNRPREALETRDIGVGCDLLPRHEAQMQDVEPVHNESAHVNSMRLPSPFQPPSPVKVSSPTQSLSPTRSSPPPQPLSPTRSSQPTQPLSPIQSSPPPQPLSPIQSSPPPQPLSPIQSSSPPQPLSPIQSSSPPQPLSPIPSSSPLQPLSPIQSSSPPQPLSPIPSSSPPQPLSPIPSSSPPQPLSPIPSSSPPQPLSPTQTSSPSSPIQYPSFYRTPFVERTFKSNNPPPSRLASSILRYTPVQYSSLLQSNPSAPSGTFSYNWSSESQPDVSPVQSGKDEVDAERKKDTQSSKEESSSSPSSSQPRSRAPRVYTPFMKLMEITSQINIE